MKSILGALFLGFTVWLGIKSITTPDFPWGSIYVLNVGGKVYGPGEASFHFNSKFKGGYISFENNDPEKGRFYYKFSDGTSPKRIHFTHIKYNQILRVLTAVCDFRYFADYLNVYYDQYTYSNVKGHSRVDGFQLDANSYKESFPFDLSNGAKLTIKARSTNFSDKIPTDLIISFDKLAHPQNESIYETDSIRLNNEINTYEISIPKLYSESDIGSISMYILNKDTSLTIEKIVLEYEKIGERVSEELIFSDAFGEAVLYAPYNEKELKWVLRFKFNKDYDYTKIDNGEFIIHTKGREPWTAEYDSNWFYSKFDNDPTVYR